MQRASSSNHSSSSHNHRGNNSRSSHTTKGLQRKGHRSRLLRHPKPPDPGFRSSSHCNSSSCVAHPCHSIRSVLPLSGHGLHLSSRALATLGRSRPLCWTSQEASCCLIRMTTRNHSSSSRPGLAQAHAGATARVVGGAVVAGGAVQVQVCPHLSLQDRSGKACQGWGQAQGDQPQPHQHQAA